MGITAATEVWESMVAADSVEDANTTRESDGIRSGGTRDGPKRPTSERGALLTPTIEHQSEQHDGENSGGLAGPDQCIWDKSTLPEKSDELN